MRIRKQVYAIAPDDARRALNFVRAHLSLITLDAHCLL